MPQQTETVVLPGEPALCVLIRASARARQMSLRVSGLDGKITLNMPRGLARRHALAFLSEKEGWLRAAVSRAPGPTPVLPGVMLPVDGTARQITPARIRSVVLEDDRLLVPETGPTGARVAAFLKNPGARPSGHDGRPLRAGAGAQGYGSVVPRHALALGVVHGARAADVLLAAGHGPDRGARLRRRA